MYIILRVLAESILIRLCCLICFGQRKLCVQSGISSFLLLFNVIFNVRPSVKEFYKQCKYI